MKKVVALILVLVMTLSLCACGQTDPRIEKYEKYQLIIEHLESGNYDKVIDIVEGWAGQQSPSSATISSAAAESTEPALTPEQLAWQADAVGTWIPDKTASKDGHTGFTVNADGTCAVDGQSYTWQIDYATKTVGQINVLDGQTKVYVLQISVSSDYGYKRASLFTYTDAQNGQSTNGSYYRSEDYTVVEITGDNWQEYFEIKEAVEASENAFGEIDQFRSNTSLRLKDTYGAVNATLSSGGVEYKYIHTCQDITVDLENMTYEPVGSVRNTSDSGSTTELGNNTAFNDARYYGASIGGFVAGDLDKSLTDTVWRPVDIEIVRIQATLYLVNK